MGPGLMRENRLRDELHGECEFYTHARDDPPPSFGRFGELANRLRFATPWATIHYGSVFPICQLARGYLPNCMQPGDTQVFKIADVNGAKGTPGMPAVPARRRLFKLLRYTCTQFGPCLFPPEVSRSGQIHQKTPCFRRFLRIRPKHRVLSRSPDECRNPLVPPKHTLDSKVVSQFRGAGCQPAGDFNGRLATCPTKLTN